MKITRWFILLSCFVLGTFSLTRADDDLTARPVPNSTFFSDHTHDDDDVDGTTLKGTPGTDDLDTPPETAKDAAALEVLDQGQLGAGPSKSSDVKKLEATPTPAETPSAIPAGF